MSPEYGATSALFPVDAETLRFLEATGRGDRVPLVERYSKEQGLFRARRRPDADVQQLVELDLARVAPSLAGPRRPQDRGAARRCLASFTAVYGERDDARAVPTARREHDCATSWYRRDHLLHEHVESVGDGRRGTAGARRPSRRACAEAAGQDEPRAGLARRHRLPRGRRARCRTSTSSRFKLVGYGCTTCIGNCGPLPDEISQAVSEGELAVVSVLSGNRNFEGRIHPLVRASYLASPPLVVAYALAGSSRRRPRARARWATDADGSAVFLRDIWPSPERGARHDRAQRDARAVRPRVRPDLGGRRALAGADGAGRDEPSSGIPTPPTCASRRSSATCAPSPRRSGDIRDARCLVVLGDSVTTDHISPAGAIPKDSPAGRYLLEHGVEQRDFNSFGARRGNHEVMMRGTFGNIRLRNALADGKRGRLHDPPAVRRADVDLRRVERYRTEACRWSRWSGRSTAPARPATGPRRARCCWGSGGHRPSYERIHRSNLVGMGVLPLEYAPARRPRRSGSTAARRSPSRASRRRLQPRQV